ncbi:MAG: adenosylhopane nucleosidase [Proteobacteria bacterium]|nr:adenosylhopane nucleosidase [Pseudomonadota bacterium]
MSLPRVSPPTRPPDTPTMQARVIAVTGIAFESQIASGADATVICGADRHALAPAITQAIAGGARGVISFGIAGGLSPAMSSGCIMVPELIVCPLDRLPTHATWRHRLIELLNGDVHGGALVGVDAPTALAVEKRALARMSGAQAVDMESHIAARICAAHGVPFVALRAISDGVDFDLPDAALIPLRPDGHANLAAVLGNVARQPAQIVALIRTARDARRARNALLRSRKLLGLRFGLPDLL